MSPATPTRLVKKILSTVKTMMTEKPDDYATFWREFLAPECPGHHRPGHSLFFPLFSPQVGHDPGMAATVSRPVFAESGEPVRLA